MTTTGPLIGFLSFDRLTTVQRATVATGCAVALKGAVIDRETTVLKVNRAACAHASATAGRAITAVHAEVPDVDIPER